MKKLEALLTITSVAGIGSVRYERLIRHFGNIDNIIKADINSLQQVQGIGPELAHKIRESVASGKGTEELQRAEKSKVRIITYEDEGYPANLLTIYDYPLILYVRGELKPEDNLAIGIVGTRRASYYGKNQAERLGYDLAIRGVCIVSGLARGIDTHSHLGALKAKGRTIAVLGSGLDRIYPAENKKLSDRIAESGAVISELPMQTAPEARNFPVRNRIISGLSLGILVVEAPRRSGALITVDFALDQNRQVFVVPGRIDTLTSAGCHQLIKQGAKLVENVDDILEEIVVEREQLKPVTSVASDKPKAVLLDHREETIINLLSADEPRNIEDIIMECRLPPALTSATLLSLELKRLIRQLPGKNFLRLA